MKIQPYIETHIYDRGKQVAMVFTIHKPNYADPPEPMYETTAYEINDSKLGDTIIQIGGGNNKDDALDKHIEAVKYVERMRYKKEIE